MALFFSKLVAYTFLFWLPFYIKNAKRKDLYTVHKCIPILHYMHTVYLRTYTCIPVSTDEYTVTVFESAWLASMFDVGGIVGK